MKLGCAAYSYREALKSGDLTLEGFVDTCAKLGLDGVELTAYYFPSTEPAYLHSIKQHCFLRGMHILGTAIGSNFTQIDPEARRAHVELARAWIDHSALLGAPCVRVFAGPVPAGIEEGQAFEWALACLRECVDYASERGVVVALENHGGVTDTASQTARFLEAIDSPWLGINLDFGNFHVDPYAELEQLAPRAVTTHVKVTSRFGDEHRELDYGRIREILARHDYRGYLSIEWEEKEEPFVGVPRLVEQLRSEFG